MLQSAYWYSGGLDDWFIETDSGLTIDSLKGYFLNAQMANGGDAAGNVDATAAPGSVTLRAASNGLYPNSGQLVTAAATCGLGGAGRVSAAYDYTPGTTSVPLIETSTSNDMASWSAWAPLGASGAVVSPNAMYIRYRVTLATNDTKQTPRLHEVALYDIMRSP
jgi:hypothetical protein